MTHNSRKKHAYANCDETARTQIKTGVAFHKRLQFKMNGTLKDMVGFERFPEI